MSAKAILYQDLARKAIKNGMNVLAEAVSATLGPKGRNVVLGKKFGTPQIVNDGVTIAKEINLTDNLENAGVCLIRQATSKTNEVAGDGTTTATVLAYAIIKHGMRNVAAGSNPIVLKRGIERATEFVAQQITSYSRPLRGPLDITNVAIISSGNDVEVGSLIAKAQTKVGREGLISIEEGKSTVNELEITKGMKFDQGFTSGYFITDQKRMQTILENAYILITDNTITSVKDELLPTLELVSKTDDPLLIISDNIQKDVLATLILNKMKGIINVVAVRAPAFGERRKALLSDLAILTGGQVISAESGSSLHNLDIKSLGRARRVIVDKESTTIISDSNKREVFSRCEQLRRELETSDSIYEKKKLKERLGKLSGGVAVIRVGGATETEMKDRKLRIEDAVNATRAAVEEGVVPGGGSTLAHISEELRKWCKVELRGDELIGAFIVEKALSAPLKKIASNAGKNGAVVLERVKHSDYEVGYNAVTNKFVDMFDIGIIDPVRVTRSTLQNATSIASMVLTTECIIIDKPLRSVLYSSQNVNKQ
jgi:chaperonin GroEL|tara:strand:- start:1137 stop:2762 length:1626 start_codon:yes stop_codon:yes gene_type:complete